MPALTMEKPKGILRSGWVGSADDYAIDGGWAWGGEVFVVGDAAGSVTAFEGKSGKTLWKHAEAHDGGLLALAVHPDSGVVATAGQDGRIVLWSAKDGEQRQAIEVGTGWVENLAWSSDGNQLATSLSRRVFVYGRDGAEMWRTEDHPSTVSAIAWSGSDELATACYGQVAFFGASAGEENQKLQWQGSLVSMHLSPNGDIVACGSQDNSVHFWRRSTGQDSMMSGYPGKPSALAFDDTGVLLATGGGEAVTVWSFQGNGPEGTSPGVLEIHGDMITSLTFSPRSRRLASGARDGSVAVWSLGSDGHGDPIGAARLDDLVAGLAWRPDGRGLAALDARGGVTTWRVGN